MTRLIALGLLLLAAPLSARDSLGVFDGWAAFRDSEPRRCYAIAKTQGTVPAPGYAMISNWPERKVRGAVHLVLSRSVPEKSRVRLTVGGRGFDLVNDGRNAWARDAAMDAAIVALLRSTDRMSVRARSTNGRGFTDRYTLAGVATAMDAATVGCAARR